MIAIFIIIALVAAVSLYDYFTTRSWQQVTSTIRNEAVFENRNKKYGAFVIRRDYNRNLILILIGLVGGVGVIYAAAAITRSEPKVEITPPKVIDPGIPIDVSKDPEPEPEPEIELPVQKTLTPEETVKFTDPKPTDKEVPEDIEIPEEGKKVGNETIIDPNPDDKWTEPGDFGDPEKGKKVEIIKTPLPPTYDVDEPAEYPGGREKMKEFLSKNLQYPELDAQEGNGGKCYLRFIVDKQGDISEVKVMRAIESCPDCNKEAVRIVKKMPRWKPGKKKGEAVDSYFNLPITFKPA